MINEFDFGPVVDEYGERDLTLEAFYIEGEIDNYIEKLPHRIYEDLDDETKENIKKYPTLMNKHYNICEDIKNKYLLNDDIILKYNIDLDSIIKSICKKIILIVLEITNDYEPFNDFYRCLYFNESDNKDRFIEARDMFYMKVGVFPELIIDFFFLDYCDIQSDLISELAEKLLIDESDLELMKLTDNIDDVFECIQKEYELKESEICDINLAKYKEKINKLYDKITEDLLRRIELFVESS